MTILEADPRVAATGGLGSMPPLGGEAMAGLELARLVASPVYMGVGVPRGNGRAVLVIPGFLGSDEYLRPMRGWLRRCGYEAHASGIALNLGTPSVLIGSLLKRLDYVAQGSPARVIVIGHSLGGVFARALAVLRPQSVAHAICLGAPLGPNPRESSHPLVAGLGGFLLSERGGDSANEAFEHGLLDAPLPPTVELTSIYSRSDAIVRWSACIDRDPRALAIEVHGTHTGLAWNEQVYRVLGSLLAASPL